MTAVQQPSIPDFATARYHMIECQLRPNRVRDERILEAMGRLPREEFVPQAMAGIAYIDEDLQVARGRYLLEPMVLARLLEEANIRPHDRVLDIACATGYSTTVLASIAREVVGIEPDANLQKQATDTLASLAIKNAEVRQGVYADGCKDKALFDVIVINGCAEVIPQALFDQLAEGGRMVVTVLEYGPAHAAHVGEGRLYEKAEGVISYRALFDANVKLLPGFEAPRKFTF